MQADENLRSELEDDVKEECVKLGPVDAVKVIYLGWNLGVLNLLISSNFI